MRRRTFLLAAAGTVSGLAGCTDRTDAPGTTSRAPTTSERTPTDATTATTTSSQTTTRTPTQDADLEIVARSEPAAALEVASVGPVEGTMVNLGARGRAKNTAGSWLVDCRLRVTGEVGGEQFSAVATRNWLAPKADWEWKLPFGKAADGMSDDSVTLVKVEKDAAFWDYD